MLGLFALGDDLLLIVSFCFLLFSFYATFKFRSENNLEDFLLIMTICVLTDIGGYIFGKLFKGPKLTKISPNKTIFGSLGSFILPLLLFYLLL